MKQYLTIKEFASLRNVSIGSLRYYEKLRILEPAKIDPETKYRYYLPEQVNALDTISFCVGVGIPLRDLKKYIDRDGKMDHKAALEYGKKAMQDRIAAMRLGLETTQFNLNSMEQNQAYSSHVGIYTRRIEERFFIEAPFAGDWHNPVHREKASMSLFHSTQKKNMVPVFPAGVLVHWETTPVTYSFFVQVLHPAEQDDQIIRIPRATFSCMQIDLVSQMDILKVLKDSFPPPGPHPAIISNMLLNKLHFNSRHSEIQVMSLPEMEEGSL